MPVSLVDSCTARQKCFLHLLCLTFFSWLQQGFGLTINLVTSNKSNTAKYSSLCTQLVFRYVFTHRCVRNFAKLPLHFITGWLSRVLSRENICYIFVKIDRTDRACREWKAKAPHDQYLILRMRRTTEVHFVRLAHVKGLTWCLSALLIPVRQDKNASCIYCVWLFSPGYSKVSA